jgi:hypothetical protein
MANSDDRPAAMRQLNHHRLEVIVKIFNNKQSINKDESDSVGAHGYMK